MKRSQRMRWTLLALLLTAIGTSGCAPFFLYDNVSLAPADDTTIADSGEGAEEIVKLNQPPVEPIIHREGSDLYIEMTAQVTDVMISQGVYYNAWTFNGTAPGPVLRAKEGDTIHFTLNNLDPYMPHSMDFHAVHAAPSKKFVDVQPNESGSFSYEASMPGVFMYHCGTSPALMHIANGMHGVIVVEPKDGYPTDDLVDREYVITQNEWYEEHNYQAFEDGPAKYVVFNGNDYGLIERPLLAKVGDRVRLYVNNLGPNHVSSFHVVGTIFDTVYLDGNPANLLQGMQTVLLPASGGAVVEFVVKEEGDYPIVTHQFSDVSKGAVALLRVTADGNDTGGSAAMTH
ncbi:multicopper oxidase domain-containing protein [Paenibacillus sp. TRM 82003]|nr:multicopper oxidase domain-containing protein [Paenibacillus sp. TRM 82003]